MYDAPADAPLVPTREYIATPPPLIKAFNLETPMTVQLTMGKVPDSPDLPPVRSDTDQSAPSNVGCERSGNRLRAQRVRL